MASVDWLTYLYQIYFSCHCYINFVTSLPRTHRVQECPITQGDSAWLSLHSSMNLQTSGPLVACPKMTMLLALEMIQLQKGGGTLAHK